MTIKKLLDTSGQLHMSSQHWDTMHKTCTVSSQTKSQHGMCIWAQSPTLAEELWATASCWAGGRVEFWPHIQEHWVAQIRLDGEKDRDRDRNKEGAIILGQKGKGWGWEKMGKEQVFSKCLI